METAFGNWDGVPEYDEDGSLNFATCLKLLEFRTGEKGQFWTKRLDLPKFAWGNYKADRGESALIRLIPRIRIVLRDELNLDSPPEFLAQRPATVDAFLAQMMQRQDVREPDYLELDMTLIAPPEVRKSLTRQLTELRPIGRVGDGAPRVAMITSHYIVAVRSLLALWLSSPEYRPKMRVIHVDALRCADSSMLLSRILNAFDEKLATGHDSMPERIAKMRQHARYRKFLLIIENIDCYRELGIPPSPADNGFRIGIHHCMLESLISTGFMDADPDSQSRLIMTAQTPYHKVPGNYPIVELAGTYLSAIKERALIGRDEAVDLDGALSADAAAVDELSARFRLSAADAVHPDGMSHALSPENVDGAAFHISRLSPETRTTLRLIATSLDGLRVSTMVSLINTCNLGDLLSAETLKAILALLKPVVEVVQEILPNHDGTETAYQIRNPSLRMIVLKEWESTESGLAEARRAYRVLGGLILEVLAKEKDRRDGRDELRILQRTIQAAQSLLASINPRSTAGEIGARDFSQKVGEIRKRLVSGSLSITDSDVFMYVTTHLLPESDAFLSLFERPPAEGKGAPSASPFELHLRNSEGLFETKFRFLLHFLHIGTAIPDEKHINSNNKEKLPPHMQGVTARDALRLCTIISKAATQCGKYEFAIGVAKRGGKSGSDDVTLNRHRYRVLLDSLIRTSRYGDAMVQIDGAIKAYGLEMPPKAEHFGLPTASKEFASGESPLAITRRRMAIDLYTRQGEIHMTRDNFPAALVAFDNARNWITDNAGRPPTDKTASLLGSNGRRYVSYKIASGLRGLESRMAALGEADRYLSMCETFAKQEKHFNGIVCLSMERARLHRIEVSDNDREWTRATDREVTGVSSLVESAFLRRFDGTVSSFFNLEIMAEKARMLSFLAHAPKKSGQASTNQFIEEALGLAKRIRSAAKEQKLPYCEAEANLLFCELLDPVERQQYLDQHDEICERHGIRIFLHPRSLIVHGLSAARFGAW